MLLCLKLSFFEYHDSGGNESGIIIPIAFYETSQYIYHKTGSQAGMQAEERCLTKDHQPTSGLQSK